MSKRQQFIIVTIILTVGLEVLPFTPRNLQIPFALGLGIVSYITTALVLLYDLKGIEYFSLPLLPGLLTFCMASIFFFFPNFSLPFRFAYGLLFITGYYFTLLSANILNVAKNKPLPLFRVAYTVLFLSTLFTGFLFFTLIYKAVLPVWLQLALIFIIVFILGLASLWTVEIPERPARKLAALSLFLSLMATETAVFISFLPIESFFRALALATSLYIYLGVGHQYLRRSLSHTSLVEYGIIAIFVGFVLILV